MILLDGMNKINRLSNDMWVLISNSDNQTKHFFLFFFAETGTGAAIIEGLLHCNGVLLEDWQDSGEACAYILQISLTTMESCSVIRHRVIKGVCSL